MWDLDWNSIIILYLNFDFLIFTQLYYYLFIAGGVFFLLIIKTLYYTNFQTFEKNIFGLIFIILGVTLVYSYNLFLNYIILELLFFIICFILTSIIQNTDFTGLLKYFYFNAIASIILLISITLTIIYYELPSLLYIVEIYRVLQTSTIILAVNFIQGLLIIGFGLSLLIKIGIIPFSWWRLSTYVTGTISIYWLLFLSKLIYFILLIKIIYFLQIELLTSFTYFLYCLSFITFIVGILLILYENTITKFIGLLSFVQFSLNLFILTFLTTIGFNTILLYFIFYISTIIGFFIILQYLYLFILQYLPNSLLTFENQYLTSLNNFKIPKNFKIGLILIIGIRCGLPPLLGFFIKNILIIYFLSINLYISTFLILRITSLIIYYYIKIIKFLYNNTNNQLLASPTISSYLKPLILNYFFLTPIKNNLIIFFGATGNFYFIFLGCNIMFSIFYLHSLYFFQNYINFINYY